MLFCGPAGFGSAFNSIFLRAYATWQKVRSLLAAEWLPKIENYGKGALFRVKPSGWGPSIPARQGGLVVCELVVGELVRSRSELVRSELVPGELVPSWLVPSWLRQASEREKNGPCVK